MRQYRRDHARPRRCPQIANLLDNALAVSSPGSTAEVTVDRAATDIGPARARRQPALFPENCGRDFDRFRRARTDTEDSGRGGGHRALYTEYQVRRATRSTAPCSCSAR